MPDNTPSARIARVIDFETTGRPEDQGAEIIEAGFIDIDLQSPDFPILMESRWETLVKPVGAIPAVTMAVHHIMPEDVVDAPPAQTAWLALCKGLSLVDVFAAHKADFEKHFFKGSGQKFVCTYKCALRAWPDAPNHTNQGLRYHLALPVDRVLADPPHRALPDAYVTAHILQKLLLLRPLDRLIQISEQPGFLPKFNFGKHVGKTFKEVAAIDRPYLSWIVDKSELDADVKFTAGHWLKVGA